MEHCDTIVGVCVAKDPEECDGEDNDGDGRVDEASESTAPLADNQAGVCSGSVQRCVSGAWIAPALSDIEGYEMDESACDGVIQIVMEQLTRLLLLSAQIDKWGYVQELSRYVEVQKDG